MTSQAVERLARHVLRGTSANLEALLLRFAQPLFPVGHRAHLAGQADLAECHQRVRQRTIAEGSRRAPASTGRSHAVSVISMPPTTLTNTSCSCSDTSAWRLSTASSMATRFASSPCAMRRGAPKRMRSTSACSSMSNGRPPSRVTVTTLPAAGSRRARQKDGGGVTDLAQPGLRHREESKLVGRPETVLGCTHDAEAAADVAFEVEHRVHQVLEHSRAGDGPFLRDVPNQHHSGAAGLGEAHQLGGALAQLRDRARARSQGAELHGLDGIHHQQARPCAPRPAPESPRDRSP